MDEGAREDILGAIGTMRFARSETPCDANSSAHVAKLPERIPGDKFGYHFFSNVDVTVLPGECKFVDTGINVSFTRFPAFKEYFVRIYPTAIISAEEAPSNVKIARIPFVGTDESLCIGIVNDSEQPFTIKRGGQFVKLYFSPDVRDPLAAE